MQIPLVDLKAQFRPLREEILAAIDEVLKGMNLFLGENTAGFEEEFAAFSGAAHGVGVSSGTDALYLALRALGIGHGDEVITVANTFFATVEAIVLAGGKPVLVDIDPDTYTIDVDQVEAAITPRTRAIVPVHLYGQPAEMDRIMAIAAQHGLRVLEDACQAHGAQYHDRRAGSLGHAAAFSFYFSKNLGAYGEAGMVVTADAEVARRVRTLRDHGSLERYRHDEMGGNHRMDELQAAVLRVKLRHLEDWNEQRRAVAAVYNEKLRGVPGIATPVEAPGRRHVYHIYGVRVPQRDRVRQILAERGIATGIHYPVPINRQPGWLAYGLPAVSMPVSEAVAAEILSLPMYPELSLSDAAEIADILAESVTSLNPAPASVLP